MHKATTWWRFRSTRPPAQNCPKTHGKGKSPSDQLWTQQDRSLPQPNEKIANKSTIHMLKFPSQVFFNAKYLFFWFSIPPLPTSEHFRLPCFLGLHTKLKRMVSWLKIVNSSIPLLWWRGCEYSKQDWPVLMPSCIWSTIMSTHAMIGKGILRRQQR